MKLRAPPAAVPFRAAFFFWAAVLLPTVLQAAPASPAGDLSADECGANLRALAHAVRGYAMAHNGQPPKRLSDLHREGYVLDLRLFTCPVGGRTIADPSKIDAEADYEIAASLDGKLPLRLAREKAGHHGGQALAFYSDRTVRRESAVTAARPPAVARNSEKQASPPSPPPAKRVAVNLPPTDLPPAEPVAPSSPPELPPAESRRPVERAHYDEGMALYNAGKYAEAVARLERAVEENPDDAASRGALGGALYQLGRYAEAAREFGHAARLAPAEPRYLIWASGTSLKLGRFAEAENAVRTALRIAPNNSHSHAAWGHLLFSRGSWHDAANAYVRAIELEPNNGEHRASFAGALYQAGHRDRAVEQARYALQLGFRSHWVYERLGLAGASAVPTN